MSVGVVCCVVTLTSGVASEDAVSKSLKTVVEICVEFEVEKVRVKVMFGKGNYVKMNFKCMWKFKVKNGARKKVA